MIIIVEGPDGAGKDTFINNLAKLTGVKKIRGSSFEISQMGSEGMLDKWKEMLLCGENIIINRFFYSNAVYGPMFGYPTISPEQFIELNDLVNERAIVYYINADTDILIGRINARGDDDISTEDIKDIQSSYDHMWGLARPDRLIRIDSSDDSLLNMDSRLYERVLDYSYNLDKIIKKNLSNSEKE